MTVSALGGWIAVALIPLAASTGWILRRIAGPYARRMRPHSVLGYGAGALALAHAWTSADAMGAADRLGVWFATLALAAMVVQTFLGLSLQAPGAYRLPLRRWHSATLVAVVGLVVLHVALNGPAIATVTAFATAR